MVLTERESSGPPVDQYPTEDGIIPLEQPIGVHPSMCQDFLTTIIFKESSLKDDDITLIDLMTNQPMLKCTGSILSLHDRKKIYDMEGHLLFNISSDRSYRHSMTGNLENGKMAFEVHVRRGGMFFTRIRWHSVRKRYEATFINIGGERKTLLLEGVMRGPKALLKLDDGTVLGVVSPHLADRRSVSVCGFPLPRRLASSIRLTVAPNVDVSLMAAICICFDKIRKDADNDEVE